VYWKRLALAFATVSTLLGCGDDRTPLVLYSPHGRDLLTLIERTYEQRVPAVDVRWLDMGSQEIYDRLRSEAANPQADVWFGGPAMIFARGAADDLLQPFEPAWAGRIDARRKDPLGRYHGLYLTPPLLVYNEAALSEDEAPRDWDDLLDDRWRDQIVIRDPLASGTMRTIFAMILSRSVAETGSEEAGFEWLRRLDAQTRDYVQNPALLHEKLARQEGLVTMWELTDILFQRERGGPLGYRFASSGTPVIVDCVGLVAGAGADAEAKAFIEWIGSREALHLAAAEAYRLPARDDLPPAELPEWAQQALAEIHPADVDWDLVEERGSDWMIRWDREVRGAG
jgi:iron(III) transport system substrate-binding protein